MNISDKVEDVRDLIADLSEDIDKILAMAQFAAPAGEGVAKRVLDRMAEIRKLFEEKDGKPGRDS